MSSQSTIEAVRDALRSATTFTAVFGPLPGDGPERQSRLKSEFKRLATLVHPDVAPKGCENLAAETFSTLSELRASALDALEHGRYERPFAAGIAPPPSVRPSHDGIVIESAGAVYRLESEPYVHGDFSTVYRAEALAGPTGPVLVKLATEPAMNQYLEHEVAILSRATNGFGKLPRLKAFLPDVVDAFLVPGEGGLRYRATAMRPHGQAVSLTEIRERLGRPLDSSEAGWVSRRIAAQVLAAGMLDTVHGAITPDHVLVDPITREPCHIGWAHAADIRRRERVTTVIDRWRDWYPPEVVKRKVPDFRTDLFMAATTIVWMVGGDTRSKRMPSWVPSGIRRVIEPCTAPRPSDRPKDPRAFLDSLTRAVRDAWGRSYVPLELPDRK